MFLWYDIGVGRLVFEAINLLIMGTLGGVPILSIGPFLEDPRPGPWQICRD